MIHRRSVILRLPADRAIQCDIKELKREMQIFIAMVLHQQIMSFDMLKTIVHLSRRQNGKRTRKTHTQTNNNKIHLHYGNYL